MQAKPKFAVGQELIYRTAFGLDKDHPCTVLRILPETAGRAQYRIKVDDESAERVADEGELRKPTTGHHGRFRP